LQVMLLPMSSFHQQHISRLLQYVLQHGRCIWDIIVD
jgi:hypothetical protein